MKIEVITFIVSMIFLSIASFNNATGGDLGYTIIALGTAIIIPINVILFSVTEKRK